MILPTYCLIRSQLQKNIWLYAQKRWLTLSPRQSKTARILFNIKNAFWWVVFSSVPRTALPLQSEHRLNSSELDCCSQEKKQQNNQFEQVPLCVWKPLRLKKMAGLTLLNKHKTILFQIWHVLTHRTVLWSPTFMN